MSRDIAHSDVGRIAMAGPTTGRRTRHEKTIAASCPCIKARIGTLLSPDNSCLFFEARFSGSRLGSERRERVYHHEGFRQEHARAADLDCGARRRCRKVALPDLVELV